MCRSLGSPIYLGILDASKAFDKVNHWSLFKKLLLCGLPAVVVRILLTWYANQLFYIRWGNTVSCGFNVINGVRQGSIISPVFFNIYVNDLSCTLQSTRLGCNLNGTQINHLLYADDTVLIASTPSALQGLINICIDFAACNEITYNAKKSRVLCMQPQGQRLFVPEFVVDGIQIS